MSRKGAIAITQEHADVVSRKIRCYDVKVAIAVHVAHSQRAWVTSRGEGGLSLKGAIAIAQEHAGGVGVDIRGDDIEPAITN